MGDDLLGDAACAAAYPRGTQDDGTMKPLWGSARPKPGNDGKFSACIGLEVRTFFSPFPL